MIVLFRAKPGLGDGGGFVALEVNMPVIGNF